MPPLTRGEGDLPLRWAVASMGRLVRWLLTARPSAGFHFPPN
jgi:hypothetical protein